MVIWTPLAQVELKRIHDHIAQEAPINAKKVTADLVIQTNSTLSLQQDISKRVPEFNRDDLREIHIYSWRVIYHLQTNNKFVLTLFHKRRDLTSGDIALPEYYRTEK